MRHGTNDTQPEDHMTRTIRTTPIPTVRFQMRRGPLRVARLHLHVVLAWTVILLPLSGCATKPESAVDAWRPPPGQTAVDRFELIRDAADEEALYTLAGGLKPMSSGIWQGTIDVENPDLTELRDVRRALGHLRNDVWYADVQVFNKADDGERWAQAFVIHRDALARMIERLAPFWSAWGITPCTHPAEIVAIVDRMPKADRWRGYGHLFGYPDDAVDFFVEAGLAITDESEVGPGKDREFIQIPTHVADSGQFTYAVPLDHAPTSADRRLAECAELILTAYEERRPRMTDVDDTVELLLRLNDRFEHLTITEPAPSGEGTAVSPG